MKRNRIILALTMSLLFTGCGAERNIITETQVSQEETAQADQTEETITEETVQQQVVVSVTSEHFQGASDESLKDVEYTYEYDMPQITISGNEAAQEKIQKDLESYVTNFLNSLSQNEFGYIGYMEEGSYTVEPSYQNLSMEVIRADSKVISIMLINEGYDHGAHGWVNVDYLNYFTSTGDTITFDALGEGFRDRAKNLVAAKAAQIQQEEDIFYPDYQDSISLVVMDGTESQKEVYNELYGDMDWSNLEEMKMPPTFYVTDTGFGFTSGQYTLQPYSAGIIDFTFTAADFDGACTADIFTDEGAMKRTIDEESLIGYR